MAVEFVLVSLAVLVGAAAQRVSGMGFSLVVAPALVILLGPFDGVLIVNICGAASAAIVMGRTWRYIDWKQYLLLAVPAGLAILPGAFVTMWLGGFVLQILVGATLLVALTISLLARRVSRVAPQVPAGIVSGLASGFMSATAGLGGPGASVYRVLTGWEQRSFAATVQPFFLTLGVLSFVTKIFAAGQGPPQYELWFWILMIVCTVCGLALGELLALRVSVTAARHAVTVISYAGGVAALMFGIARL
ncbi:sulfite exporter TauE/SafE family protein [Glaciibacter superstes]|uniref:sulfite exporter TauE/SafE family protein n=1 Tax=Glaciibacter superstes TaxID=501023 RepID=UPI0003B5AF6F|nr:sulfite exporter TauE/SafE family protein [Glaciibacter superstes]